MEVIMKKEERNAIDEMVELFGELSTQEKRELEFFVKGYKLARGAQGKKSA